MKVALTVGLTVLLSTVAFGQASDLPVGGDTGIPGATAPSDTPDGASSAIGALSGTNPTSDTSVFTAPDQSDQGSDADDSTGIGSSHGSDDQDRQNYAIKVIDSLPISQKIQNVGHNSTPGSD